MFAIHREERNFFRTNSHSHAAIDWYLTDSNHFLVGSPSNEPWFGVIGRLKDNKSFPAAENWHVENWNYSKPAFCGVFIANKRNEIEVMQYFEPVAVAANLEIIPPMSALRDLFQGPLKHIHQRHHQVISQATNCALFFKCSEEHVISPFMLFIL